MSTPAFAGTLTAASFTAPAAYTSTNAINTRYGWGFTTATTSTLSKVTATVPAGTGGSNRYLDLPALANNSASTPDSAANSVTSSVDIRIKVSMSDWYSNGVRLLLAKRNSNSTGSYSLALDGANQLEFAQSQTGSAWSYPGKAIPAGWTANSTHWLRATLASSVSTFYWSDDGSTWTSLGTATGKPSLFDSTYPVALGTYSDGPVVTATAGNIYYGEIRSSVDGTVVNKFDPGDATATQAAAGSWTSSDATAETWTVNRSGTNQPADIATDLSVGPVSGVPSGGTANYRFIDGTASYYFPVNTSISSGTPCAVDLGGFTNTATAGNYSSTIKTWDNSATPVQIDSTTTSTLSFTDTSASVIATATIDPTFVFSVANQSSACNGESNFRSTAGTPTAIALGSLAQSSNVSGGQALTVVSNAANGFAIYIKGTQASKNLRSSRYQWSDVSGTYASPAALSGAEEFGFTYKDSTAATSVSNPSAATFAKLDNTTGNKVMGSPSSQSGSGCVSFDARTGSATPAGAYTATVVYTAVPSF